MKVGILGSGEAFNSVDSAHMVDPKFAGGPPTMFICGEDAAAKATVRGILEPLCILWCIPGLLRNDWSHAFKLLS